MLKEIFEIELPGNQGIFTKFAFINLKKLLLLIIEK